MDKLLIVKRLMDTRQLPKGQSYMFNAEDAADVLRLLREHGRHSSACEVNLAEDCTCGWYAISVFLDNI